jgi:hypothetical protein
MYSPVLSYAASNTMRNNKQIKRSKRRAPLNSSYTIYRAPQYTAPIPITKTYRFVSSNATSRGITLVDLLGIAGISNYAANTNVIHADSMKLHKIEAWSLGTVGNTIDITFYGPNEFIKPSEYTDECVSTASPAHVLCRPTKGLFSEWLTAPTIATNPAIFSIASSVGTIVDVTVSHLMWQDSTNTTPVVWTSVASGTLGKIYYLGLDGTGGYYAPIALPTLL